MSSSSTNGSSAKAKAQSKNNIAALAARNLGGFVPNKIFVGGVPIQATEEQFKAYFERFGAISKVELHALRGFGYITYEQVDSVDQCLEKYEEHYLCKKWVEVKRSIPRELIDSYEREQKRLEAEFKRAEDPDYVPGLSPPEESPSVKVETPSNSGSSAPAWGMPAPSRGPVLPSPGVRSSGPKAAPPAEEPGGSAMTSQIQQLTEMGFSEALCRRVFRECAWDFNKALDRLLSTMGTEEAEEPADAEPSAPEEDPPLSAAVAPAVGAAPAVAVDTSPQASAKAPAWGKAPPPASVWGMPKQPVGSAWGKQASPPPSAKAPPGTPKAAATTPKAGPGTPKSGLDAFGGMPPAALSPGAASPTGRGGYNSTPVGAAPAKAEPPQPQSGGQAVAPSLAAGKSPPATPPPKPTSSAPPPPAFLPPAADGSAGTAKTQAVAEPRIPPSEDAMLPPTSQPSEKPTQDSEANGTSASEAVVEDPIAVAAATNLLDDEEDSAGGKGGPGVNGEESKGGHLDAPGHASGDSPPRKRVQRMKREWTAEDPSQLSAAEGDFVQVWIDTGTEHGWIHSEKVTDGSSQVGWLPVCVLQQLPENRRWMKTKQAWQAMGESQCNVENSIQVVVWVDSRTDAGWTYVEASEDTNTQPGWLPDFCLEWTDGE